MSYSGRAFAGQKLLLALRGNLPLLYLNLKEEPLVKSTGLGLGLGSSKRRKKA